MESATWISKYLSAIREPCQFDSVGHRCLLGLVQTMDFVCLFSFLLSLSLQPPFWSAESAPRFVQLCVPSVKGQRWKEGWRKGGWKGAEGWTEQGTTNITGGRAAGESRPVISQDFVIETLLEVEGSRRINATPLLLRRGLPLFRDSAQPSQVEERQLNGMSNAILVPFLVPFFTLYVSSVSFLSPSVLFFFLFLFLFFSLLSISIHLFEISLARDV